MPVLQVSNLHKRFADVQAVDGVSFSIDGGEIFGLLGPNGAGKSTTINIIATLLPPDDGEVLINGCARPSSPAYKRKVGFVPQELSLTEKLTARENLMLIGRLYDLHGRGLRECVSETLHDVGLADRASDLVSTFSGGMKRRLNIAAALLHQPELLLLDEPTAGVDTHARAYIFEIIERLSDQGRAVLYTTHYMEEAQRLCKRTAIIDHGKILATGTLAELTQRVNAKRDLVIEADGLTCELVTHLADKLGGIPWTLDGEIGHLNVADTEHTLLQAVHAADDVGIRLRAIALHEPNLETVFLEMTGRALRE
ncbi:MAG: ABC transporter ATP-binding protein [Planctomycetota bacterium]